MEDGVSMPTEFPELVTINAMAEKTGLKPYLLRRLARDGEIPAVRFRGGRWYINRDEFARWLKENSSTMDTLG